MRIAFRFCFVYFVLYSLVTQISGDLFRLPGLSFPGLGPLWPLREFTIWIARNIWHVRTPLEYSGNSGDSAFFWVQMFWVLIVSVVITAVWVGNSRERQVQKDLPYEDALHKWLRLFLRLALAAQMFSFGMAKVIPTQMPAPPLTTLLQPVGNLSLQGLLWVSIGASTAYEIFTGVAEVIGGILLLFPRTTTFGALVTLANMIQVFVLNLTYDIGVKLISFHLILMTLFLLAPDFRRLANVLFLNRTAGPSTESPLFRSDRANRVVRCAQLAAGIYLLVLYTFVARRYWYAEGGGGTAKSPLYGIWNVQQLSIDGQSRPPDLNDYDRRWRRVVFDAADSVAIQRTDDSFARYGASFDAGGQSLSLSKGDSQSWKATFTFERPEEDRLFLNGMMDQHEISARLQLVPFDTFRLLNSPFRWIRPPDPPRGEN